MSRISNRRLLASLAPAALAIALADLSLSACGTSGEDVAIGNGGGGEAGSEAGTDATVGDGGARTDARGADANGTDAKADSTVTDAADGGSTDGSSLDGHAGDATVACGALGQSCATARDCCSLNCSQGTCAEPVGNNCALPGIACATGTECCTGSCVAGQCANRLCTSDLQACNVDTDCCGGSCVAQDGGPQKVCKPLNPACLTSGNMCTVGGSPCCSGACLDGVCTSDVSACTQQGDSCGASSECCSGYCAKASGAALGVCGELIVPGGTGCTVAGQACGAGDAGVTEAGVPACGGACCSRACGPSFVSGILVCQPPSGCRPTGELCRSNADCCGSTTVLDADGGVLSNGSGECSKANLTDEFGRCSNGNACRPIGAICKVPTTACTANAENNCCSGNVLNNKPETWIYCQQDLLGIPRCTGAGDCSGRTLAEFTGKACASSADCCNLAPCVPVTGDGGVNFRCAAAACLGAGSGCTADADCCRGTRCELEPGDSAGTCKFVTTTTPGGTADGGTTGDGGPSDGGATGDGSSTDGGPSSDGAGGACGVSGQLCGTNGDCCSPTVCLSGRCGLPI
jgi:hypothetical protein